MKPIQRVKMLIEDEGISISAFERKVGLSNNSIQTAIKRKANLKDDTIAKILKAYPEISPEWILLGNGTMKRTDINWSGETVNEAAADYITLKDELIASLQETIKLQREKIQKLEGSKGVS
jgi:repressor LexA